MPARLPTLTLRELNRALLARQLLLKRTKIGVVDAIERLGCLQGQWAPSPYVALWSRLAGFERDWLTRPIDRGEVVKATLMRATLHIVSAREYPAYSLATMDGRFGAWRPSGGPVLVDLERVHRRGHDVRGQDSAHAGRDRRLHQEPRAAKRGQRRAPSELVPLGVCRDQRTDLGAGGRAFRVSPAGASRGASGEAAQVPEARSGI